MWTVLVLLWTVLLLVNTALSQDTSGDCVKYDAELHSRPDFSHNVMTSTLPLPPDFSIISVKPDKSRERSFYWCEMVLKEEGQVKTMRRYGHNATHWWVTKGCGGWFFITACPHRDTSNSNHVDPTTTPTVTTVAGVPYRVNGGEQAGFQQPTELQFADLNSGALLSLVSWLREQDRPIEHKLGPDPKSRVARSVDEEFAFEFGAQ